MICRQWSCFRKGIIESVYRMGMKTMHLTKFFVKSYVFIFSLKEGWRENDYNVVVIGELCGHNDNGNILPYAPGKCDYLWTWIVGSKCKPRFNVLFFVMYAFSSNYLHRNTCVSNYLWIHGLWEEVEWWILMGGYESFYFRRI